MSDAPTWIPGCGCARCDGAERAAQAEATGERWRIFGFMIVCPLCGNKRCPRASSHDETCTASNKPGQAGSRYVVPGTPPEDEADK